MMKRFLLTLLLCFSALLPSIAQEHVVRLPKQPRLQSAATKFGLT
jgi:hypothetical protein